MQIKVSPTPKVDLHGYAVRDHSTGT